MARMQYKTRESSINYSSTRTDGETRTWKPNKGLPVKLDKCRIRRKAKETVMYWLSGGTWLALTEYLKRHNNGLMILCVTLVYKTDCWEKIQNSAHKTGTREQSLRMMNVSYAGTSNNTYVKQQQEEDQMWPLSTKTITKYFLLIGLVQTKTLWMQNMHRSFKNTNNLHSGWERDTQGTM